MPGSLCSVGSGFVERVEVGKIFFDRAVSELFENDTRQNSKIFRSAASQMSNENRRRDDVSAAAEEAKSARRVRAIDRFADHAPVEFDEGIGGQNDVIGLIARDNETFAQGVPACGFAKSEIARGNFANVWRDELEWKTGLGEQLPAARRSRGENQSRLAALPARLTFHGLFEGLVPRRSGIFISE